MDKAQTPHRIVHAKAFSFEVRWPCYRFVFAGLAGGPERVERVGAAGKAGEYKAVARPPHFERKHGSAEIR